jgi:hypothetical protein
MQRLRVWAVTVFLMRQGEQLGDVEAIRRARSVAAVAEGLGGALSGSSLQHRVIPVRVFWFSVPMLRR